MSARVQVARRILIIDDDEGLVKLAQKKLISQGYEVQYALSGAEALDLITEANTWVLLLDHHLPDMNGLDLIRSLREKDLDQPFVAMTGHGDEQVAVELMKLGALDYLSKTIGITDELGVLFEHVFHDLDLEQELLRTQEALQESQKELVKREHNLKEVSRMAKVGGWSLDLETMEPYFTSETYHIYEIPEDGPAPQPGEGIKFYAPSARPIIQQAVNDAIEHGKPYDLELPFITGKGRKIWIRTKGQVEVVHGKTVRLYGLMQDITARKTAEEKRLTLEKQLFQSQKLEAIGTMVSGISHELNNIFQSLFLHWQQVNELIPEDNEIRRPFEQLFEDSQRARDIVKQILTFSRNSKFELKPRQIQPSVHDSLRLVRASLAKNIELKEAIDAQCGMILSDTTQIHQIIINLCHNAEQAMGPEGGVIAVSLKQLSVESAPAPGRSDVLELSIADTGMGMTPKIIERIFDPFFTTKSVGKGTGLGLSVIHGLVEMMGGTISVTSDVGKGSLFTIRFPVVEQAVGIDASPPITFDRKDEMLIKNVLLIDDEENIRLPTQLVLESRGLAIDAAEDGEQALEFFRSDPQKYDLIITDLSMPRMSGVDLAKQVRDLGFLKPIILSSGNLGLEDIQEYQNIGISAFIQKPWTADQLLQKMQDLELIGAIPDSTLGSD